MAPKQGGGSQKGLPLFRLRDFWQGCRYSQILGSLVTVETLDANSELFEYSES